MWALRPGRARGRKTGTDLEALYHAHFGLVWSLVGRYGVRPSHREDVVQEVWLTVHRRLPSFDRALSAAHWIAGVTRYVAWRHIRTMIRADRKLEALRVEGHRDVDDPIVDRETLVQVGAALASLEPMFRDAVMSVEIEGWSGPEAAQRLGVPLNTLYSRLRLGRRRLRDTLLELERSDRPHEPAPREAAARTWAAIAPIIAPIGKASLVGSLGAWMLVPAAAVVGLGVVAIAPPAREEPTIATTITTTAVAPEIRDAVREPPTIARGPELAPPQPVPIARVEPAIVRASAVAPTTPATVRDADDAGDEAKILGSALAAIERGDGPAALAMLHEHETRFANGELAIERRSARVRALCLVGKGAQARGEAATLLRDHPDAAAAIAVGEICPP